MAATQKLFNRRWVLQVGDLEISSNPDKPSIDVSFTVRKSTAREPNECEILIYNLKRATRSRITQSSTTTVILKAGYEGLFDTIFSGDVRESWSYWELPDAITRIAGSDSGTTFRNSTVSRTFPPGTRLGTVLRAAVESLSVGVGNLADYEDSLRLTTGAQVYPEGTTIHGPSRQMIDRICRSCGYRWSIQNGSFIMRRSGAPVYRDAYILKASTGLIGSPSPDKDGNIEAQSLLIPGLIPGRPVQISSREVNGNYKIKQVEYTGETFGQNWYANLNLNPYETRNQ